MELLRDFKKEKSMITSCGGLKLPTRFLIPLTLMDDFPPMQESQIPRNVVGI